MPPTSPLPTPPLADCHPPTLLTPSTPTTQYREVFLRSEGWRKLRAARLQRDGGCCCVCGVRSEHLDVHHIFYRRTWADTRSTDLRSLCRDCHNMMEFLTEPRTARSLRTAECRWDAALGVVGEARRLRRLVLTSR